jgi:hypothetical protein
MTSKEKMAAALRRLPQRPWHTDIAPPSVFQRQGFTMRPGDQADSMILPQVGFEVGTVRMPNDGNVLEPWPESNSMIVALPGVLSALSELVNLAQEYVDSEE